MTSYTIPYVTQQRAGGERSLDIWSRLLADRIVYLGTPIDDGVANVLVAQMLHLNSENPDGEISLYVNSPGGSPTAMLSVYDTMRYITAPVATTCVGEAGSAAAVLMAGGAPGRRLMLPHARVVLHQPSSQGQGSIPDLIVQADEVLRLRGELEQVLSHHTGRPPETIRRDTDRDLVLPAAAAVAYGVADHVVEFPGAPLP